MKTFFNGLKITFFGGILAVSFVVAAAPAVASTPILSVSSLNNFPNNTVTLTIYADPNSSVQLYSENSYVAMLGVTNSSGYLSATLPATSYNIPIGSSVYVMVNGQQSPAVAWPSNAGVYCPLTYQTGTSYQYQNCPPLPIAPVPIAPPIPIQPVSTGSLTVGVNQTATVYGQGSGPYSVTSNSNPSIVSASASGNTITFSGVQTGSASVMVCPNYANQYSYGYNNNYNSNYYNNGAYTNAPCADFIITVIPAISFSQSNVTLYGVGSSQSVVLYGGGYNNYYYPYNNNGYNNNYNYFITNNTNPSAVSATVNGSSLIVYAVGLGGSNIMVCSQSGACGTVYVSVNGSMGYQNYGYPTYYQPYSYNYTSPQSYSRNYYRAPTPISGGWYRRW